MVSAQTQLNANAAKQSAALNAVNLVGPYGSVTYDRNPDGTPRSQITSLNDSGQYVLGGQEALQRSLVDAANQRLGAVGSTPSFSLGGIPYNPGSYNTSAMPTFGTFSTPRDNGGPPNGYGGPSGFFPDHPGTGTGYGMPPGPQAMGVPPAPQGMGDPSSFSGSSPVDHPGTAPQSPSGAPGDPGMPPGGFGSYSSMPSPPANPGGFGAYGGQSTGQPGSFALPYDPNSYGSMDRFNQESGNALYNESMRHLQPQFDTEQRQTEQRLADRGIPVGSEAWSRAMDQMSRSQGEQRQSAINNATSGAGAESSRMAGLEQGLRNQAFNEATSTHNIQTGDITQRLSTEQNLRNQMIQEMLMGRQMPIQEIGQLLQTSPQLGMPTAPGMQPYNIQSADQIGAQLGTYNAQMQAYNAQQNRNAGAWQGAANLAGTAAMAYAKNPAAWAALLA